MGVKATDIESDEIVCSPTDEQLTLYTNKMHDTLAAFTYTLVECGWINIVYNGREIALNKGDLYVYSPGYQVTIVSCSADYRGICLMADEGMTFDIPTVRNILRTTPLPITWWKEPVMRLGKESQDRIRRRMQEVIACQSSFHSLRDDVLRSLYTIFLLDLADIMEYTTANYKISERTTGLFVGFMRLLPKHFVEHHDIGFYANSLYITTTHLSRIVKQVSGRTVCSYINQLLACEASWLLTSTTMSVSQIAARLHFASTASFDKFFMRMRGKSPKELRR